MDTPISGRNAIWHEDLTCWFDGADQDARQVIMDIRSTFGANARYPLHFEDVRAIRDSGQAAAARVLRAGCSVASQGLLAATELACQRAIGKKMSAALPQASGILLVVSTSDFATQADEVQALMRRVLGYLTEDAFCVWSLVMDESLPAECPRVSLVIACLAHPAAACAEEHRQGELR